MPYTPKHCAGPNLGLACNHNHPGPEPCACGGVQLAPAQTAVVVGQSVHSRRRCARGDAFVTMDTSARPVTR